MKPTLLLAQAWVARDSVKSTDPGGPEVPPATEAPAPSRGLPDLLAIALCCGLGWGLPCPGLKEL